MPQEKIRLLSILIFGATIAAYVGGNLRFDFFLIQIAAILPLWFPIDLVNIREHWLWKIYGVGTLLMFVSSFFMGISMETSVFFLVLFCIIYEFYGEKRPQAPTRLLSLLSFLIVVYQSRIESGLNLLGGVLFYLVTVMYCLSGFYIDTTNARIKLATQVKKSLWASLRYAPFILLIGLGIYWVMPRLPTQSLSTLPNIGGERMSGFSDRVTLNDIGALKLSRKHVMDIKPLSGTLHSSYLKGRVLDRYDQGVWTTSSFAQYFPAPQSDKTYRFHESNLAETFEYRIDSEAIHGNTLFYFNTPLELQGKLSPLKVLGAMDHLSVLKAVPLAMTYKVRAVKDPLPRWSNMRMDSYLQIPKEQGYMREISQRILAQQEGESLTDRQKVQRFMAYFKREFKYTLEIHNKKIDDPLRYFLEEAQAGHCELFASSLVFLLRAQGVPARLVTGFLMPDIHPSGEFFYVTESDAHAWTEYYHDGVWLIADPTPPAIFTEATFLETQLAYLKRFWRNMIITWNYDAQKEMVLTFSRAFTALFHSLWDNYIAFCLSLLTMILVIYSVFKFKFYLKSMEARLKISFRDIDYFLQKQYRPQRPTEAFVEYVKSIRMDPAGEIALLHFFKNYTQYRFGPQQKQLKQIPELIKDAKLLLKQLKRKAKETPHAN